MRFLLKLAGAAVFLLVVLAVGAAGVAGMGSGADRLIDGVELMSPIRVIHALIDLGTFGLILVVLGTGLIVAMKSLWSRQSRFLRETEQPNETLMIQEIHAGLSRMEDRVEALETILFDRAAPSPSGHGRSNAGRTV